MDAAFNGQPDQLNRCGQALKKPPAQHRVSEAHHRAKELCGAFWCEFAGRTEVALGLRQYGQMLAAGLQAPYRP